MCVLTFIGEWFHGLCDLVGSVEGVSGLGEISQAFNRYLIKHRAEWKEVNNHTDPSIRQTHRLHCKQCVHTQLTQQCCLWRDFWRGCCHGKPWCCCASAMVERSGKSGPLGPKWRTRDVPLSHQLDHTNMVELREVKVALIAMYYPIRLQPQELLCKGKEWIHEPFVNKPGASSMSWLEEDQLEIANDGGFKIMFQSTLNLPAFWIKAEITTKALKTLLPFPSIFPSIQPTVR